MIKKLFLNIENWFISQNYKTKFNPIISGEGKGRHIVLTQMSAADYEKCIKFGLKSIIVHKDCGSYKVVMMFREDYYNFKNNIQSK